MIGETDTRSEKRVAEELENLDTHFSEALDEAIEESLYHRFEERALTAWVAGCISSSPPIVMLPTPRI